MKVLIINGSPRDQGTTSRAIGYVARELAEAGIETESVAVGHRVTRGCTACGYCFRSGTHRCVYADDPVNECIEKAAEANGFLLASPVHYGGISGGMKCFLDRFFYAGTDISHKAAASLVCLRRSGGVDALHALNNYLHLASCVLVPTPYWSVVHGNRPEDLEQDAEGVFLLRTLGRNMAWLLAVLQQGKAVPRPERITAARTDFVQK